MVCAIIQARMSSSRLPGKVIMDILGQPMLVRMIERVRSAARLDKVVVATSVSSQDDAIEAACRQAGIECFRGNLDDVLDRYYQTARTLQAGTVVRLTGDCPLIDPVIIDQMVEIFERGSYDYLANTVPPPGTYPDGMDVEIFTFKALEKAWREATKPSDREHVTFYFWKNAGLFRTYRYDLPKDLSSRRLTVDYPEDFQLVSEIYRNLYEKSPKFGMSEILGFLDSHPEIANMNDKIRRNQGWETAMQKDRQAGFKS